MSDIKTQTQRNADVDCTSGHELIASFQQAEIFYHKAADHLCDYAVVIDLFRYLGAESHRLGAELSQSFHNVPEVLSVETHLGFDFTKVVGGGASLMVMEAEQGTLLLLKRYDSCLNTLSDSDHDRLLRRQKIILLQVHSQLAAMKHSLYFGEPID